MKGKELFDIINDIDERFVQELYEEPVRAEVYRLEKRRGGWIMPTLAGAACLAVIVGAAAAVRFGGKEQFTSDHEFPDGKPDWVYDGAANGGATYEWQDGDGRGYPPFVLLDKTSPFYSSASLLDYDEWNYGNFRDLPFVLPNDSEYYNTHDQLLHYTYSAMLYHPSYSVWEDIDTSILGADYVEVLGCEVPAFRGGEVVYAGAASKGNAVIIKHTDDDYSLCGYLDELFVKAGDTVTEGQTIATTGGTGINEYAWYDPNGEYVVMYDCVLTLWHAKRAIDVYEWNRYVDSREGVNCLNHTYGMYLQEYNKYLAEHYPETLEKTAEAPEEWVSRPHVKPTKNTHDNFDFFNTGDKITHSKVTNILAENGEEVYAVDDGEVVFADWYYSGGKTVVIKHTEEIYTLYCHLNANLDYPVKVGDAVKAGQLIGYAGSTGDTPEICVGYGRCSEMPRFTVSTTS